VSDALLCHHGIYVQPINYPTVLLGSESFRFTASPTHTDERMEAVFTAVDAVARRKV
jgi:5-aminolevulinate synthase